MKLSATSVSLSLVFFLTLLTQSNASIWRLPHIPENQTNVVELWTQMDKNFKSAAQSVIKTLMPRVMESSSELNVSSQCMRQGLQLVTGLRSLKNWAFSCESYI
ncbi:NRF domain-containing protein [Trichonephila inaurata madagascariensis]|uniref:NRF domain-containing protein n=1 Tax=Trichonephila inaurata madagascariensis TaxID=2747483 RepID=A0A8X7CL15_9ARAC|nr:NRF domain-containing protein [Trichonephila inaurata madagascariensis]